MEASSAAEVKREGSAVSHSAMEDDDHNKQHNGDANDDHRQSSPPPISLKPMVRGGPPLVADDAATAVAVTPATPPRSVLRSSPRMNSLTSPPQVAGRATTPSSINYNFTRLWDSAFSKAKSEQRQQMRSQPDTGSSDRKKSNGQAAESSDSDCGAEALMRDPHAKQRLIERSKEATVSLSKLKFEDFSVPAVPSSRTLRSSQGCDKEAGGGHSQRRRPTPMSSDDDEEEDDPWPLARPHQSQRSSASRSNCKVMRTEQDEGELQRLILKSAVISRSNSSASLPAKKQQPQQPKKKPPAPFLRWGGSPATTPDQLVSSLCQGREKIVVAGNPFSYSWERESSSQPNDAKQHHDGGDSLRVMGRRRVVDLAGQERVEYLLHL